MQQTSANVLCGTLSLVLGRQGSNAEAAGLVGKVHVDAVRSSKGPWATSCCCE